MPRKRTEGVDLDADPAALAAQAMKENAMTRYPVTAAVAEELAKYQKARHFTQGKVAEELAADLLALFRGEVARFALVDSVEAGKGIYAGDEIARFSPIPSLKDRAAKAVAEEW